MRRRLNITNGDIAVGAMRSAGVAGDTIPWRDVLHEGPVDSSLPLERQSEERAKFIAEREWGDLSFVRGQFAERDRTVAERYGEEEIVLWFEHDLYDQLQLIQLLHFFASSRKEGGKLSLVQVDGYIPPLSAADLLRHEQKRAPVSEAQLELGARAWKAFGEADPGAMGEILGEDTSVLPYLAPALRRLMQEYPEVGHGLSRIEAETLRAIEAGHATPVSAFMEVARKEESIFLGDAVFYWRLERLSAGKSPLVTWDDGERFMAPNPIDAGTFRSAELIVTDTGREVLSGKRDWQTITDTPRWIGGIEISPGEGGWRWDQTARRLVRAGDGTRAPKAGRSAKPGARGKRDKN